MRSSGAPSHRREVGRLFWEQIATGITVAMSRKGNCWDNAPIESVNGTLKVECVNDVKFEKREQARQTIIECIGWYNTERRYSSLSNTTPAEFEQRWRAGVPPSVALVPIQMLLFNFLNACIWFFSVWRRIS
jgi:transposase InsO family protein